jgi:lipopolysaccharide export system protein LptA
MTYPAFLPMMVLFLFSAPAAPESQESFSFSGDRTSIRFRENDRYTVLNGNAVIETDTLLIRADEIELYGPDFRFISCSGSVSMEEKEKGISLKTARLFYDRQLEITRVRGYTELLDRANELSARCYYMEQEGETGSMVLQTAVRIDTVSSGKAVVCRSEMARYDRDNKTLELLGSPIVDWKGDEYRADRIIIDTGRDTIRMEGAVSGSLTEEGAAE